MVRAARLTWACWQKLKGLTRPRAEADGAAERAAGNAALQAGDAAAALHHYERYAAACPGDAAAHLNRGYALLRLQRHDAAVAALRESCRLDPASHEARYFLAQALVAAGDDAGAEQALAEGVRLAPADVPSWTELGRVRVRRRLWATAREAFERAAALQPDALPAWEGVARVALAQGDGAAALPAAERCLQLAPQSPAAVLRAEALLQLQQPDAALAAIDAVPAAAAPDTAALRVRAAALLALQRHDEAVAVCRDLVGRDPADPDSRRSLVAALLAADRAAEALPLLHALPDDAAAIDLHAQTLLRLLQPDAARALLLPAVARWPADRRLAFTLAVCELTGGDWAAGWKHYASRPQAAVHGAPRWLPGMDIAGRRVMLLSEQGLGDAIQFARYVPEVLKRGPRSVVLQVAPPLRRLVDGQWPGCEVVTEPGAVGGIELYCPLLSLPHVLDMPEPLSPPAPYVRAAADRRTHWRDRIGSAPGPVVGLVWSGNAQYADDRRRSIPLALLRAAAPPGVRFVSLQLDIRDSDRAAFDAWPGGLLHPGREQADMADTAALIEQLDGVVAVDTSVAHLAGALGRPLLLMLLHCPDWRWGLGADTTPWYPSARLFRQPAAGDWQPVVQAAMAAAASL